jgi:hypothetical protein
MSAMSLCVVCLTSDPADSNEPFLDWNGLCAVCADTVVPPRRSQRECWRCPDCHKKRVRQRQTDARTGDMGIPYVGGTRYVCFGCGWWASLAGAGQSAVQRARLAMANV